MLLFSTRRTRRANWRGFSSAALASDADGKDTGADRVTLMTLHSSKGLEFPVVCPWWAWSRDCSLAIAHSTIRHHWRRNDVFAMSASPGRRSVCSSPMPVSGVFGVACARRPFRRCFFRSCRRPWCRGIFPRWWAALRRERRLERLTRVDRDKPSSAPANAVRRRQWRGQLPVAVGSVGDQVIHSSFGLVRSPIPSVVARGIHRCEIPRHGPQDSGPPPAPD